MTKQDIIMQVYLVIGILYAIINGAIRKINSDGDWLLTLVWIFLWPLAALSLITKFIYNKLN